MNPERELAELQGYLGAAYDHDRLVHWERALDDEAAAVHDEARLYRTSEAYLYNLTAFAMSRTKEPYLRDLTEVIPPPARLLDYGCGIGSDGLALLEAGYEVHFADFDNPSTRYLHWRLRRRGLVAPVYDLDHETPPGGFDCAYALDVIEHVDDPFAFLSALEQQAAHVLVNFLDSAPLDTSLHRDLPVRRLLRHAARRRVRRYRRYHGRSHVVLYGARPAGPVGRARSRARLALGATR
jgi:hypothetical protein